MEFILYQWLTIHKNSNNNKRTITLIDCLIILSTNNIYISCGSLIKYYDNVIKNTNSNTTVTSLVQPLLKTIYNNDNSNSLLATKVEEEVEDIYYGLNKKQFQIFEDYLHQFLKDSTLVESLKSIISTGNIPLFYPQPTTTTSFNNDSNLNNKIQIIIDNNKNHPNHIPKLDNINKEDEENEEEEEEDGKVIIKKTYSEYCRFFKVWRNIVIKREILFHLRLFNVHLNKGMIFKIEEITSNKTKYKFYSYLDKLVLNGGGTKQIIVKPNLFPSGLREIVFNVAPNVILKSGSIPNGVTTISFKNKVNQTFTNGMFPNSLTELNFTNGLNQSCGRDWLPNSIKILSLGFDYQQYICPGQLPESITELNLHTGYKGLIINGSIPSTCKSFNFKFNSKVDKLNSTSTENGDFKGTIPITTTYLEFDDKFNQDIKVNDIPKNVNSIKFGEYFNSNIDPKSLSSSIKSLEFVGTSYNVKLLETGPFPISLTHISLGRFCKLLSPTLLPHSIQSIKLDFLNNTNAIDYQFKIYQNLKSLDVSLSAFYDKVIPVNCFPESLVNLSLRNYDVELLPNVFPKSILKLELPNYNCKIQKNVLPPNLTILSLPLVNFNQELIENENLPNSLKTIFISYLNNDYLKSLDYDFFIKFIKLYK